MSMDNFNLSEKKTVSDPVWALCLSAFFSDVLIPTYSVILAMWLTPLSQISEKTRFLATLAILAFTAVPTLFGRSLTNPAKRYPGNNTHLISGGLAVVGLLFGAFYLYSLHAPGWLSMILVAQAATVVAYVTVCFFTDVSGHACGMASLCAVALYLGRASLSEVSMTPWLVVLILLAGLVGSARLALTRNTSSQLVVGYIIGTVVTYLVMNLDFIETKAVG